jgi:hypothetical protein
MMINITNNNLKIQVCDKVRAWKTRGGGVVGGLQLKGMSAILKAGDDGWQ